MASDDQSRHELFDLLEAGLGSRTAVLLMAQLPPVGWADIATKADLGILRGEMAELRSELKGERAELRGEMAELRGEIRAQLPKFVTAMFGLLVSLAAFGFGVVAVFGD
jgi:hypothetical protein